MVKNLINGNELYDIEKDRYQIKNLVEKNPEVVVELLEANANFLQIAKAGKAYNEFPVNVVGNVNQKEIKLTIQHAIGDGGGIWKAEHVAEGMKNVNNTHALKVEQEGWYEIRCCRWPKECAGPVLGIPAKNPKGGMYSYQTISPEKVRLQIANQLFEKAIYPADEAVTFKLKLEKGKTFLVNDFIEGNEQYGVYYTYVEYLGKK